MLELQVLQLKNFQKALNDFAEKTRQSPKRVAKKMVLELHRQTVLLTPVDTGRLVGGWQISTTDALPSFHTNPYDDGVYRKDEEEPLKNSFISSEQGRNDFNFKSRFFWVANNVEYARFQEFGTGKMQGKHMFTTALTMVKERAQKLAKRL